MSFAPGARLGAYEVLAQLGAGGMGEVYKARRVSSEMRAYDILPDGRFVGLIEPSETESSAGASSAQMRVVLNWFEELKTRVPAK